MESRTRASARRVLRNAILSMTCGWAILARMKVPLIDLTPQVRATEAELREAIERVLGSRAYILGPEVESLEGEIAATCGVRHGIGVSNGSDALVATLTALGVGADDEVVVPVFTFFATAGAVARVGARPVFVEIEPETFNIDPDALADVITERTRAIIPVHLYGQCAPMDRITSIAGERGIPLIEDAAQAIGATYRDRPACSLGTAATLSFYPTKNLSAIGEAGMVLTDDDDLADRLRSIRNHGQGERYEHHWLGGNYRMDGIQAAALRVKLHGLADWTRQRRELAARYDEALGDGCVTTPVVRDDCGHVYHQYTIRSRQRDALRKHLADAGIGTGIYYPLPLHRQPCFAYLGCPADAFPVADRASREVLSLPIFPGLTADQQGHVIESTRAFG